MAAARFAAVLVTAAMDEAGKAAWRRANGVYLKDCSRGASVPPAGPPGPEPDEAGSTPHQGARAGPSPQERGAG